LRKAYLFKRKKQAERGRSNDGNKRDKRKIGIGETEKGEKIHIRKQATERVTIVSLSLTFFN
jgi:hypothetical protein